MLRLLFIALCFFTIITSHIFPSQAKTLKQIQQEGELKHLGVPYANFVTGLGDGLSVEVIQMFAHELGVKYKYIRTSWKMVIPDLIGHQVKPKGDNVELLESVPIRGDIIANGLTKLPWREKVLLYSDPTFPTQVWIIASASSSLQPIQPSGNIDKDIAAVKKQLKGKTILGKKKTCLDGQLYGIEKAGARFVHWKGALSDLAPAVINGLADATLLDVPDALIALEKWPGEIKVIGPVSPPQVMGVAFPRDAQDLRAAFNKFLAKIKKNGQYFSLVKKYYPVVFDYFPEFFQKIKDAQ
jgi:ABC-type amino acid transport substrate-binding protein